MTITRSQYRNKEVSHQEYYLALAKSVGVSFSPDNLLIQEVKEALDKGDEHLNSIPLFRWDNMANNIARSIGMNHLKQHEESNTLAVRVCILKAAARNATTDSQ